jgi:hypothetical protein
LLSTPNKATRLTNPVFLPTLGDVNVLVEQSTCLSVAARAAG